MREARYRFASGPRRTASNPFANLWIWLFALPLAMDYKAAATGDSHAAQILLVIPVVAAGLVLMLIGPRLRDRCALRALMTVSLMLAVPASVFTQWLQQNTVGQYLRVLLPFALFQLGFIAACRPWQEVRLEQFEKALFWANAVSLGFTCLYGLVVAGSLADVRYRLVSVTFLALQGVLLHEFVIAKRYTALTLGMFMATVVIELLSVTRSLVVGTGLLFVLAVWMSAAGTRRLARALLGAALAAIMLGTMAFAAAAWFPDVAEHWVQRIDFAKLSTETGMDPTTITRLAEMRDQYDQVVSSPVSLLVGEGYGHDYRYSPAYLSDLAGQMSKKEFYAQRDWAAGHNFWVYQFFAGGLLFGLAFPLALLYALIRCSITYRRWHMHAPDTPQLPVLGRAILMTAALPAASIGGNPLGPRFSGLVFGIGLGLMVAMHAQLSRCEVRAATRAATERPARERIDAMAS
ncbi:hypothetical protein [Trinickia dinghuensis]|uniref:hypothetical protein n=1 Tax=Trinickia dinghuensis TaxID=2291023 RepID=UPI0015F1A585|nr:hypothetical protein [Trinickia dinghuensis]